MRFLVKMFGETSIYQHKLDSVPILKSSPTDVCVNVNFSDDEIRKHLEDLRSSADELIPSDRHLLQSWGNFRIQDRWILAYPCPQFFGKLF